MNARELKLAFLPLHDAACTWTTPLHGWAFACDICEARHRRIGDVPYCNERGFQWYLGLFAPKQKIPWQFFSWIFNFSCWFKTFQEYFTLWNDLLSKEWKFPIVVPITRKFTMLLMSAKKKSEKILHPSHHSNACYPDPRFSTLHMDGWLIYFRAKSMKYMHLVQFFPTKV